MATTKNEPISVCIISWNKKAYLQDRESGNDVLKLAPNTFNILTTLETNAQVEFQFWLEDQLDMAGSYPTTILGPGVKRNKLCAIIYGPSNNAAMVGTWLEQCSIYLQLPEKCNRNLRYSNPHCMSFSDDAVVMTSELQSIHTTTVTDYSKSGVDYYAELDVDEGFAEALQPALISTPLHGSVLIPDSPSTIMNSLYDVAIKSRG